MMNKNHPDRQRLKNKPTPTDATKPDRPRINPKPWGEFERLTVADLHQWGKPTEWPPLQPWGDGYKRPWGNLPD